MQRASYRDDVSEDVKAWANRWRAVAAAERAELRSLEDDTRAKQIESIFMSAVANDWQTTAPAEVDAVRARWMLLRKRLSRR